MSQPLEIIVDISIAIHLFTAGIVAVLSPRTPRVSCTHQGDVHSLWILSAAAFRLVTVHHLPGFPELCKRRNTPSPSAPSTWSRLQYGNKVLFIDIPAITIILASFPDSTHQLFIAPRFYTQCNKKLWSRVWEWGYIIPHLQPMLNGADPLSTHSPVQLHLSPAEWLTGHLVATEDLQDLWRSCYIQRFLQLRCPEYMCIHTPVIIWRDTHTHTHWKKPYSLYSRLFWLGRGSSCPP